MADETDEMLTERFEKKRDAYRQKLEDDLKRYIGLKVNVVFDESANLELHVSKKDVINAELKEFQDRAAKIIFKAEDDIEGLIRGIQADAYVNGLLDEYNPYFEKVCWISKELSDTICKLKTENYKAKYKPKAGK